MHNCPVRRKHSKLLRDWQKNSKYWDTQMNLGSWKERAEKSVARNRHLRGKKNQNHFIQMVNLNFKQNMKEYIYFQNFKITIVNMLQC